MAIPYFVSFVLLVSIVMLNLFTAVIIENFEKQQVRQGAAQGRRGRVWRRAGAPG